MRTLLLGFFAHGRDIQEVWYRANKGKKGARLIVCDEDPDARLPVPDKLDGCEVIYGMNNPTQRLLASTRYDLKAAKPLIDPSAIIGKNVTLKPGAIVFPNALLFHSVRVGRHVHIGYNVSAVRTVIKAFSTISPGVTICGDVEIGKACSIGAGATISNLVTIGDGAVIGAGAVVPPFTDIPAGTLWAGVPARQLDKPASAITVKHRVHQGDNERQ